LTGTGFSRVFQVAHFPHIINIFPASVLIARCVM
jgi:hypothetical protein